MIKFNVGSAQHGVNNAIEAGFVFKVLQGHGFVGVSLVGIKPSDTEDTYIFTADGFVGQDSRYSDNWTHKRAVFNACQVLQQDCIAYKINDTGYLVGPKADAWGGEFNQDYFLE